MASDQSEVFPEIIIKYKGQDLVLHPPSWQTRKRYTTYLESQAIQALARHRREYHPQDYSTALKELNLAFGAKEYNWGTEKWNNSLNDEECFQELAYICFTQDKPGQPGMPLNFLEREIGEGGPLQEMWYTPYTELDMYSEAAKANGMQPVIGGKIVDAIMGFIRRPNLSPPAKEPGNQSNTPS